MTRGNMEEDHLYFLMQLILSFLVLLFVKKMADFLWWRPRKLEERFAKQGIKGPPYRFLIGNVKEIGDIMMKASSQPMSYSHDILPRVLSFYHHWKKIYGATFLIWFGPKARLTVADPDQIREIFTSKSEFYEKIDAHPIIRQLEGNGLLSLKGEKWDHRRKTITPTFHMDNLKLLVPTGGTSVIEMLEKWLDKSNNGNEVEIEVSGWFEALTEDIVTRTAFGPDHDQGKAIYRLQARYMKLANDAFQRASIPGYRFLPTVGNIKSWKLEKQVKKALINLVDERKAKWGNEKSDKEPKDMVGLMIQESLMQNSIHLSNLTTRITANDIAQECKTFFFAGEQTTANLLTWTTVLLAMHPDWQLRARDEVLKVCGPRGSPSTDDLSKLKTLNMIINETLRLYPPVVATLRRAVADVELGGYKIPKDTELLIPILAVHHDQTIWGKDANEFNPARFSNGAAQAANHPAAFIPFGLGFRQCIGQNLAILHSKLALSIMLQRSSFRLAPQYQHAPMVLMLLYPQYGAPIIFQRFSDISSERS